MLCTDREETRRQRGETDTVYPEDLTGQRKVTGLQKALAEKAVKARKEIFLLVITNNFLFRQFLQLWNPLACNYVEEPIAPVMGERF
jgi:hypothetical protein